MEKKIILLIGPDRSGSSIFSKILHTFDELNGVLKLNKNKDYNNPTGYYESKTFVDLNEDILKLFNKTNYDTSFEFFNKKNLEYEVLDKFEKRINSFISSEVKHKVTIIKDPRLFKMHKMWEKIFKLSKIETKKVITWRGIDQMALSLKNRSHIPQINYMIYLIIGLLNLSEEDKIYLFSYNMFSSYNEFIKLSNFLNLNFKISEEKFKNAISDFQPHNKQYHDKLLNKKFDDIILKLSKYLSSGVMNIRSIKNEITKNKIINEIINDQILLENIDQVALSWKYILNLKRDHEKLIKKLKKLGLKNF